MPEPSRPRDPRAHDRATRRRGLAGEALGAAYLAAKGYRLLARRFRTRHGEIDLIVRRRNLVAFVEVKAHARLDAGLFAVTPRQQRRIADAARAWLARPGAPRDCDFRFDVLVLAADALPRHIEGAFTTDAF